MRRKFREYEDSSRNRLYDMMDKYGMYRSKEFITDFSESE